MVYCRVSNKVRFFIYNIYTVNLHYRSKKKIIKNTIIIINIECIHIYSCVCCLRLLYTTIEGIVHSYVSNSYREFVENSCCRVLRTGAIEDLQVLTLTRPCANLL